MSDINAGQGEHQLVGGALERFGHSWQKPQQLTAFRQTIFRVEAGIQFSIEEPDVTLLRARLIYKRIPNLEKGYQFSCAFTLLHRSQRGKSRSGKRKQGKRLNPVTVNRRLTVIKHMFKKAVEWDLSKTNPANIGQTIHDHERAHEISQSR